MNLPGRATHRRDTAWPGRARCGRHAGLLTDDPERVDCRTCLKLQHVPEGMTPTALVDMALEEAAYYADSLADAHAHCKHPEDVRVHDEAKARAKAYRRLLASRKEGRR